MAPSTAVEPRSDAPPAAYWDETLVTHFESGRDHWWRVFCDELHERLVDDWAADRRYESALKTDLFDEAADRGPLPALARHARRVEGIDVSPAVVAAARARNPGIAAAVGDVRALDLDDARFDLVLSNSTLDHFPHRDDIRRALAELHRVMAPGGTLILTLDNPRNPVVGARSRLPLAWLSRTGLVPYFVGVSLSMAALVHEITATGFEVLDRRTLMHVPRLPAIWLCRLARWLGSESLGRRLVDAFHRCEALAKLPTGERSAYYVAVRARRRERPGP